MTFSHSVPWLTWKPSSCRSALASDPILSFHSSDVYVLPDKPHVNGFFACSCGTDRYLLSSTKSGSETVSGTSVVSSVSHWTQIGGNVYGLTRHCWRACRRCEDHLGHEVMRCNKYIYKWQSCKEATQWWNTRQVHRWSFDMNGGIWDR